MAREFILAIDEGTTGVRAIVFDQAGTIISRSYQEFTQHYPQPGWVEHDPTEIWQVCGQTIGEALSKAKVDSSKIAGIGIANQRETTIVWDKHTGQPVCPAIVWQCRRTASICDELKARGLEPEVKYKTGLVIDAYFSGTKLEWILDNVPGVRSRAERGEVIFGTIDTWLVWNLTRGEVHCTDYTNASRTMVFNIHKLDWDPELLGELDIPRAMLPQVRSSSEVYGYTGENNFIKSGIPIAGIAGDQQAALFGQACFAPGMAKNTYGTGCFMLLNTGKGAISSSDGLLTTIACDACGKPAYALEGSVFISGAAIQWLRDGLGFIREAGETEALAKEVADTGGVYVIPAFTGLGAPYWDMYARGAILGITRGTKKEHIIRATLESIAYQSRDLLEAMTDCAYAKVERLRVDGGGANNDFLMQFQADILDVPVERPVVSETTALGAAFLAGLAVGYWKDDQEISRCWRRGTLFEPHMPEQERERLYNGWKKAVSRILTEQPISRGRGG